MAYDSIRFASREFEMDGHEMNDNDEDEAQDFLEGGDAYCESSFPDPFEQDAAASCSSSTSAQGMPLWPAEEVLDRKMYKQLCDDIEALRDYGGGDDARTESFVRWQGKKVAAVVKKAYRRMPPVLNENALFTRAATFGNTNDLYYHSPSNTIASNYSLASVTAAGKLFEVAPKKKGKDDST